MSKQRKQSPAEIVEDLLAKLVSSHAGERRDAAVKLAERVRRDKTLREQPKLLEAFVRALADPVTRLPAVQALGWMRAKSALEALCGYLDDPSHNVRVVACEALGAIGDPAALPKLRERYERADEAERGWALGHAIEKLERVADRPAEP